MIALDERKAQYKTRKINDVIEFEGELYVVVAIGKTNVLNNGCFETKLLCQSLVEDDSCFELNTTISKPKIVKICRMRILGLVTLYVLVGQPINMLVL